MSFYFNQEHSSRSWSELRLFLEEYDVRLPTRNEVDCMKKEMLPGGITCNEVKSDVNFDDLVSNTARGLLETTDYEITDAESLKLLAKAGMDGSGSHRAQHQRVNREKSLEENPHIDPEFYKNNMSLKGVKDDGIEVEIWANKSPNSMAYTRPLSLSLELLRVGR